MEFLPAIKDILISFLGIHVVQAIFIFIGIILFIQFVLPYVIKFINILKNIKDRFFNLLSITEEFKNNHGSSMRDAIDRIEKNTSQLRQDIKHVESRLHAVISIIGDNQMSIGIFETDINGNCIYVNNKWSDITGMSFDDAKDYGWINCIHPEYRENVSNNWDYAIRHESKFDMVYKIVNLQTRQTNNVRGYAFPIKGKDNNIISFMGALFSIDENCSSCPVLPLSNKTKQKSFVG